MFVLDCGWIGNEQVCPAKLLIFDLKGDRLVKRINIPDNISQNENGTGLLVTPLAYVPDCNIEDATVSIFFKNTNTLLTRLLAAAHTFCSM